MTSRPGPAWLLVLVLLGLLAGACTGGAGGADGPAAAPAPSDDSRPSSPTKTRAPAPAPAPAPSESAPAGTLSVTPAPPARFDADRAMADVHRLAGDIGPRLATGPAFARAARLVAGRLEGHGYRVRRQRFGVPAGDSWGVPVRAGRSANVVALPPGFAPGAPYMLVGAHLDTVAVAPGAEDNASGVAVLLELARLAELGATRLPVVLVAFGAEEPRGPGDDQHHFGSRHYVRTMSPPERRSLRAMVALDRVGVGGSVPVCTGGLSPARVQAALLRTAGALGVPAHPCRLTTSDHWSFEKAGYAVARLGSTPYAGYHSHGDVPAVVQTAQLRRTGRVIWAWLRAR